MRDNFTILNVGEGVNALSREAANTIQFTLRMDGNDYTLRLVPGFDPYATFMVVRRTELGFYRFDKRIKAMSELAEINGIDQNLWMRAIQQLKTNPTAKQTGVVFLGIIVNRIDYPLTMVYGSLRNVCGTKDPIMQICKGAGHNACVLHLPKSLKSIIDKSGCRIERLSNVLMKQLKNDITKQYGNVRVMFNNLMYKRGNGK